MCSSMGRHRLTRWIAPLSQHLCQQNDRGDVVSLLESYSGTLETLLLSIYSIAFVFLGIPTVYSVGALLFCVFSEE